MEETKCELCKREPGRYVGEIKPITFDGNTFQACDLCRRYLESDFEEKENGENKRN